MGDITAIHADELLNRDFPVHVVRLNVEQRGNAQIYESLFVKFHAGTARAFLRAGFKLFLADENTEKLGSSALVIYNLPELGDFT